jgi:hypothetical protein
MPQIIDPMANTQMAAITVLELAPKTLALASTPRSAQLPERIQAGRDDR